MSLIDYIEAISDEFQSTFTLCGDNVMINTFFSHEIPTVVRIVAKHIKAAAINVELIQTIDNISGIGLYKITVTL